MKQRILAGAWRVLLALILSLSVAGISAREARAAVYNVTNLDDSGPGSLRAAITSANGDVASDTITFNVSGSIALSSSLPAISENLTIDGSGQSITINGMDSFRVLYVNTAKTLSISNLSIVQGYSSSGNGGAIYNGGNLYVRNMTFSGNRAAYNGGAIYNDEGHLSVKASTFSSNSVLVPSATGGAIASNLGELIVVNSTFSGNSADRGGGIYSNSSSPEVHTSTFSGNTATTDGGGIYNIGGLLLFNTILANSNSATDCYSTFEPNPDVRNLIMNNWGCGKPYSIADPQLAPLADNGGPTRTFALLPGSPAFDAGEDYFCSAAPVSNLDQRGVSRPHGAGCDIGAYEMDKGRLTVRSVGTRDGWILEFGENTSFGGTLNAAATTFYVGDGASDKQYRAILSFNTATLPDTAVITRVLLKIRYQGLVGTDPFTILGGLKVDIRKPYFGTSLALAVGDFQAGANLNNAATFRTTPVKNWYIAVLDGTGIPFINLTGTTQFRLRFAIDDNDDLVADYMRFFSGDHATAAVRPMLIIDYDIP